MTQEELKSKLDETQQSLAQQIGAARNEVAKRQVEIREKQQELDQYIKSAQKAIDNTEGQILAYKDMLVTKVDPVVIGGEAKSSPEVIVGPKK